MVATLKAFTRGLHEEHLQEISLLFEQQQALRLMPNFSWPDAADIEGRIDAHLDALYIGGELALEVCRQLAREGDFGELFGAAIVFCRQRRAPLLAEVLRQQDFKDPKKQLALIMALRKAMPSDWGSFVEQALAQGDERLIPILAAVSGYQRLSHGAALMAAWQRAPAQRLPIIEALGCLHAVEAEAALQSALRDRDATVRNAAALALLRMSRGQPDMAAKLLTCALAGGPAMAEALVQRVRAGEAGVEDMLALGVLGYPPSWQVLYGCLTRPDLAEAAATALQWSSGAQLQA